MGAWVRSLLVLTVALSGCGGGATGEGSHPDGEGAPVELGAGADLPTAPSGPSPNDPEAAARDFDCDGLSDAEEFAASYEGGARTDPAKADSDGDGLLDGVELGRAASVDPRCRLRGDDDPRTTTRPTAADSDGDGLPDGREDANGSGRLDPGETDPLSPDSDGDGRPDGEEDEDRDGRRGAGETDPRVRDSDGDGVGDGVELGRTRTNPLLFDTDKDGCSDGEEDLDQDGRLSDGETDPRNAADCRPRSLADSDKDGLLDEVEDENGDGVVDPGETDPRDPDSDNDTLADGLEDRDHDGRVGPGETDPRSLDSDCDGLLDGPTQGNLRGEDRDGSGAVDPGETDPRDPDSDGDGLRDGLELGVTQNRDPGRCKAFLPDADPNTQTDPLLADSDGDGVQDGAEDGNRNGRVEPGELDPRGGNDVAGPVARVCPDKRLRAVRLEGDAGPDVQLGLPVTFAEVAPMKVGIVGGAVVRGLAGWDGTSQAALLAFRAPAPGGSTGPADDEAALRAALAAVAPLDNVTTQRFTTWDGYPAVSASYDQSGGADVKSHANALAEALVGKGAGALMAPGGPVGPFHLEAQVVHRSAQSVVTVIALTASARFVEPGRFVVSDLAGGAALAQQGDRAAVACEPFVTRGTAVDFLFVVDDSGSMQAYQAALGATAAAMQAALDNAGLDYRIALVTTSYPSQAQPNSGMVRGFTRNAADLQAWLTQGNPGWVGIKGDGTERCLEAAAKAITDLGPALPMESPARFRAGAAVHVILLGDADDQSAFTAPQYLAMLGAPGGMVGNYINLTGSRVTVHGIICPAGQNCGETQQNPQRHAEVIAGTFGVRGDITGNASIPASMGRIVQAAIASAGHRMLRPPIGPSIKVALDAVRDPLRCNADDLPRSRVDGFDFDGPSGALSFFGACRPAKAGTAGAVSYRAWSDLSPRPDGTPPPCAADPFFDDGEADHCRGRLACDEPRDRCECPADCGSPMPPAGMYCNRNRYVCDLACAPDCGGRCGGYLACDAGTCGCGCAQNASCGPGFVFSRVGVCGCVCDERALGCGVRFQSDPVACRCACRADCGGCPGGQTCNPSRCACESRAG